MTTFCNSGSALTSVVFGGDSGADVLYNTGSAVAGLVFTGGGDDDIFYNTGRVAGRCCIDGVVLMMMCW
jgi:hypothetical protein